MAVAFSARVSAGRGRFSVSLFSEEPLAIKACIPAMPEGGRANRELVFRLEELLGCRVSMLSGHISRKKALWAECSREHLLRTVRENEGKNKR